VNHSLDAPVFYWLEEDPKHSTLVSVPVDKALVCLKPVSWKSWAQCVSEVPYLGLYSSCLCFGFGMTNLVLKVGLEQRT